MKSKILYLIAALIIPYTSHAEVKTTTSLNPLTPLTNVRISMQRMLKSAEGRYYLSLYAGVPRPHGVLKDLIKNKTIELAGTQKGDQLLLNSENTSADDALVFTGNLNANSGYLGANIVSVGQGTTSNVQFEPLFKVENKPLFIFKFYGVKADTPAQEQLLTRVDVINKLNNSIVQTLTGFSAYPNSIGYMDVNFDGYYDVILSDISQDRNIQDRRYIYWMFNPKTNQYQRSPQLEKIIGLPKLDGEKRIIDFGEGQIYQVDHKGLMNPIDQVQ